MKIRYFFILPILLLSGCTQTQESDPSARERTAMQTIPVQRDTLNDLLRHRIETAGIPARLAIRGELIHASVMLPLFYERRLYVPAWCGVNGPLPYVDDFVQAVREADLEGLTAADYHLERIEAALKTVRRNPSTGKSFNPRQLVDLDLLLTDAFLIYGSHLLAGKVNPETIDAEWFANRRDRDLVKVLQNALDSNRIDQSLKRLHPPQAGYERLRSALARYREIAANGGWTTVPEGPKLQRGDRGVRVAALRDRLAGAGDLEPAEDDTQESGFFDEVLKQALKKFQRRHGLDADGVVGPNTLSNLNTPVEERLRQVKLNMERWRWLPHDLGRRHVVVNIANFELDLVETGETVLNMRVMVGKDYRRTPVFSDRMTYLVFCPYWHVPHNIAVRDLLPLIRRDPGYFEKQNMRVFQGWGAEFEALDPAGIDWSAMSARNFPVRLRQDPGPGNALGRVKFMFPNRFNVYLHDTSSRELFDKTERAFSSGCIRIEKPLELAEHVLRGDPRWTRAHIENILEKWKELTVRLPEPLPVHLLYWTAWANRDGSINFRRDIYGRDKRLEAALLEEPPFIVFLTDTELSPDKEPFYSAEKDSK